MYITLVAGSSCAYACSNPSSCTTLLATQAESRKAWALRIRLLLDFFLLEFAIASIKSPSSQVAIRSGRPTFLINFVKYLSRRGEPLFHSPIMSKTEFSANTVNSADRMRDLLYEKVRHILDTCRRRNLPGFTKEASENYISFETSNVISSGRGGRRTRMRWIQKKRPESSAPKLVARLFRGEGLLADCEENPPRLKTRATTTGIKI